MWTDLSMLSLLKDFLLNTCIFIIFNLWPSFFVRFTCGTTWHSAGLIGQAKDDVATSKLIRYSRDLYKSFEERGDHVGKNYDIPFVTKYTRFPYTFMPAIQSSSLKLVLSFMKLWKEVVVAWFNTLETWFGPSQFPLYSMSDANFHMVCL